MSLAQIRDMPRHPIYDEPGLTSTLRVRLGERKTHDRTGNVYPVETDHFLLLAEDGATDDILQAYGGGRPTVLYCMLASAAPWPGRPDKDDGRSLLVHNMNYGTTGLYCQGTGGSAAEPGQAICYHEPLAHSIAKAIGGAPRRQDDGTHLIVCRG